MTIVSIFGALLSLLILPLTLRQVTVLRLLLILALLTAHIVATLVYFVYVQTSLADATFYYFAGSFWDRYPWTTLSTPLVGHLTQLLKRGLGATYLDCFMIFQAVGFWGLMVMMRTFQEIHAKLRVEETVFPLFLLFVPSVHFWTAAIGKDALLFFALNLAVWSALDLGKRIPGLAIGLGIMLVIRPHIALFSIVSFGIAALIHGKFSFGRKLALIFVAGFVAAYFAATVGKSLEVDLKSAGSVGQFLEMRGAAEAADTARSSIASASFPVRMLSFLFRPFFFDAKNPFGLVASVENVGSLLLIGYLVRHNRDVRMLSKQVFFVRFVMTLAMVLTALLSFFNYNVGLGLRQRTMVIAPLFALFVSTWIMRHARTNEQRAVAAAAAVRSPVAPTASARLAG